MNKIEKIHAILKIVDDADSDSEKVESAVEEFDKILDLEKTNLE
jgi:hypothetical protein